MLVADTHINCWKAGGHGSVTFVQGVEGSCNPLFMTLGSRVGQEAFYKYYKAFGLTETTGFDLPGETKGTFHKMSNRLRNRSLTNQSQSRPRVRFIHFN